jgi:hypothetical protein
MAQTSVTSKYCKFHQWFRNNIRLTFPSIEIRKSNRYFKISHVIWLNFARNLKKPTIKIFGLDLWKILIIFLKIRQQNDK